MEPNININWWIIPLVVVINFVIGTLWYGPLFGATWAKEMGMDTNEKPKMSAMIKPFSLSILGSILTAYVMIHEVQIWKPSVWNLHGDKPPYVYGFLAGLFTWIGFQMPLLLNSLSWEGKSFKFFAINASHQFIVLQTAGMIASYLSR